MPATVTLARNAMATRFEIVLHGEDPVALRAAGEEALDEIDRLEAQLSLFRPESEIAHLNACAARGPVRVTPGVFDLLQQARKLHEESGGAFDITIAPLVRCWGFMGGAGHLPPAEEVAEARKIIGFHLVEMDPAEFTVRFSRQGVMLDLGAIGKGYAIERAAQVLREAGVTSALLHGGTSTIYGLGQPPDASCWKVAIGELNPAWLGAARGPEDQTSPRTDAAEFHTYSPPPPLATVPLKDEALSVSAIWGRFFHAEGKAFGHILDPRTGAPAVNAVLAAVVLPSATETDALSTALLTLGPQDHGRIARLRPNMRTLLAHETAGKLHLEGNLLPSMSQQ